MAAPKNTKRYRYGKSRSICFVANRDEVCMTGRKRVPKGVGGPPFGGTACRSATTGHYKRCPGGTVHAPRQLGLLARRGASASAGTVLVDRRTTKMLYGWQSERGPTLTLVTYANARKPIPVAVVEAAIEELTYAGYHLQLKRERDQNLAIVRNLQAAVARAKR